MPSKPTTHTLSIFFAASLSLSLLSYLHIPLLSLLTTLLSLKIVSITLYLFATSFNFFYLTLR